MRKKILFALTFVLVIIASCSKDETTDYTNPVEISGTIWKAEIQDDPSVDYFLLKFITTSTVESWVKHTEDENIFEEGSGSYSISGQTVTITINGVVISGLIEGEKISLDTNGKIIEYTKQ